jgi:hypothetical protein
MRGLRKKINQVSRQASIIGRDHGVDVVRYYINSQPRRPEIEKMEEKYASTLDRLASEQHKRWAAKWGVTEGNTWFAGMGMSTPGGRNVV